MKAEAAFTRGCRGAMLLAASLLSACAPAPPAAPAAGSGDAAFASLASRILDDHYKRHPSHATNRPPDPAHGQSTPAATSPGKVAQRIEHLAKVGARLATALRHRRQKRFDEPPFLVR